MVALGAIYCRVTLGKWEKQAQCEDCPAMAVKLKGPGFDAEVDRQVEREGERWKGSTTWPQRGGAPEWSKMAWNGPRNCTREGAAFIWGREGA